MTFVELGMAFQHDLAAPVTADTLASMIVNWLNKRKQRVIRASGYRNDNLCPNQAAEIELYGLFRKKNAAVASG